MKKLRSFMDFDINRFLEGKDLRVVGAEAWQQYDDGKPTQIVGTKYKLVIVTDATNYQSAEDAHCNEGEQLTVKVPQVKKTFKKLSAVQLVNPKATVWGDYQNQLSIEAEDITFI